MTLTSSELSDSVSLFEFARGKKASVATLKSLLPDVKTGLFFAKAYKMDYECLSSFIYTLYQTEVIDALMRGDHSIELQDYIVETVPEHVYRNDERPGFSPDVPVGEILPELWDQIELTVAESIQTVADKLGNVLDRLPGKKGQMTFQTLAKLNQQRGTIGRHTAVIQHQRLQENLVIFDVSGSMGEDTVRTIAEDVVALSYEANASLCIVSNSAFVWDAGSFDVDDVLGAAEYGGTHYEQLIPLLQEDWGTVVTIADYDSSRSSKEAIAKNCKGHIGKVVDISLVNRTTFLAECVGQLADEVEPILIGKGYRPL